MSPLSPLHLPLAPLRLLPLPPMQLLAPIKAGMAAGVRDAAGAVGRLVRPSQRGIWSYPGRYYIEVRGVHGIGGEQVARRVERALEEHPRVQWARVNAPSERVVVAVGKPPPSEQDLVARIERAEVQEPVAPTEEFDEWAPEPRHPSGGAKEAQSLAVVAADVVGLSVATALRLTPWLKLPTEAAAALSIIQHHPRLRRLALAITRGRPTEATLPVLTALTQGLATRGGGLALDLVQRAALWREAEAEGRAWAAMEPQLVHGPQDVVAEPIVVERPGEPPKDTVERFAERSMAAGAAAGVLAAPFAGPRRGFAVAFSSVPRAPGAGREGFATSLGQFLALRGVLAMDRSSLRRLGQVDTVVLDEAALRGDRYEPIDLELLGGADPEPTAERLFDLFDPDEPLETRHDNGWVLGSLDRLELTGRTGQQTAARLRRRGSERVLGLARGTTLQAVVGLAPQTVPGAEAVAAAARRAGSRIVLATDRPHPTGFTFADAVVPAGRRLVASVRSLQADGAVVLLLSGNRRALGAADCGVGVHRDGEPPAWGAHLLVGADLESAGLIVDAVGVAARVDRESALLSAGGSAVGAVAALQAAPNQATARAAAAGTTAGTLAFALGHWRARQLLARPMDPPVTTTPWHLMPVPRVLERLDAGHDGLTPEEATARTALGPRRGEPTRTTLPAAFIEELANPLTPVLAAGAALAAAVGSRTDAALVAAITGVSALVGGFQRVRTERALSELFARSAIGARVRRGGTERLVTAGDLVPGDIVMLGPEDVVPADCRLLEGEGLEVDESSLTGESLPVSKDPAPVVGAHITQRRSMLYEGTTVSAGRAVAVVVATGPATEVGRSLATARQAAPVTGVEARLTSLTRSSVPIALGSAAAVAGAGLLHGLPLTENLASAVNLAVASVPEGLPFLVNAAQLAAARRLADLGALVRNPRTIEALGRADVLCFDKTGTLTEGNLQLAAVSDSGGPLPADRLDAPRKAVLAAALRATPPARQSEPMAHQTDRAVSVGARRAGVGVRRGAPRWRRTDALPFEPSRAYHATTGRTVHGPLLSVKGAPEGVLDRVARRRTPGTGHATELDAEGIRKLGETAEELAGAGRRVLAVAERRMREGEELSDEAVRDLDFLGFIAIADPVRTSAGPALARLRESGVQTMMLTGDHPATADAIAAPIMDLPEPKVCTGPELDEMDDAELDELLPTVDVIARCSPHHKVRIVQAYQRLGRVVAMTGDGANDAPAIRLADVGIALGRRGTPAATAAADLVVTDDRLETIVSALMEGRAMWASVRAALAILIGGNFGEVTFSVVTSALTGSTPLSARQIMLVNLLTDLAPALAIAVREPTGHTGERLLKEGPSRSLGAALTKEMLLRGVITAAGAGLAWTGARVTGRGRRAGTVALAALVGTQLAQTLTTGGLDRHVLVAGLGSAAVLAAIIQTPGVSQFFDCTPLGPVAWAITLGSITAATLAGPLLAPLLRLDRTPLEADQADRADRAEGAAAGADAADGAEVPAASR